ncbi:MAG TPA: hypothetical protein V6C98_17355 [Thermosynechococcaceae cyanobacterium]
MHSTIIEAIFNVEASFQRLAGGQRSAVSDQQSAVSGQRSGATL